MQEIVVAICEPKRLGLALGGGAVRGAAHVGVLQVLEREDIHPTIIADRH
jgi:NTE family protein